MHRRRGRLDETKVLGRLVVKSSVCAEIVLVVVFPPA